jgi:hypothetical protein
LLPRGALERSAAHFAPLPVSAFCLPPCPPRSPPLRRRCR